VRRFAVGGDRQEGRLFRIRLRSDGPPHDRDQVQDRELEDEHQEDDLDHGPILGASRTNLQTQHVWPVIVADGIEALAFLEEPIRVELRVEDRLLVVERSG
jgi:hypothetical protein